MRFLILYGWPALIPILFYLAWYLQRRYSALRRGEIPPRFLSKAGRLTLISALLILMISLLLAALMAKPNAGVSYQPKQFKDGKLIEGAFE